MGLSAPPLRGARRIFLLSFLGALLLAGCAEQGKTHYAQSSQRMPLPPGEVALTAAPVTTINGVLLAKMSVTNLTERERALERGAITGITDKGESVPEFQLYDPVIEENGKALFDAIGGSSIVAAGEDARFFSAGDWIAMMLFAPAGEVMLIANMAKDYRKPYSERLRHYQIEVHHDEFTYEKGRLEPGKEVSGYFFMPNRDYKSLELTVRNVYTGNAEVVTIPWYVSASADQSSAAAQQPSR